MKNKNGHSENSMNNEVKTGVQL